MSWTEGTQRKRPKNTFLEKAKEQKGLLSEKEAKVSIVEFLKDNPTFAANILLGVELFPFQHVLVKTMMNTDYLMGVLGRGSSKTFSTAIYAALEATLNQGVKIGVLAASFRQSKMVLQKIEEIMNSRKAELFRQAVVKGGISKQMDQWCLTVGESKIVALPLGDGEKLRGFRFQVLIIDEFLLMPESIYNNVITPFLASTSDPQRRKKINDIEDQLIKKGLMKEEDRTKFRTNKIILLSSASYKFEYMYKLYTQYEYLITQDKTRYSLGKDEKVGDADASRAIIHMSYEAIPKEIFDQNLLVQARETMSDAQFAREFKSEFTDDSAGYFKMSQMNKCTVEMGEGQHIEIKGDAKAKYIMSFDPSWSSDPASDDFSISVLKLDVENRKAYLVHGYAIPGTPMNKHISYFKYLLESFNIVMIVGDYNGGVVFIDACNQSKEFKDANLEIKLFDFDADTENYNDELKKARREYNLEDKRICHLRIPSSKWIRKANEQLQLAFDRKRMLFAAGVADDNLVQMAKTEIPSLKRLKFVKDVEDSDISIIDFIERQKEVVDLTKTECALINPRQSASGTQVFDLPENLRKSRSPNKPRKDSYSSLVLGNWAFNVYIDMMNYEDKPRTSTFKPFFLN